MLYTRESGSEPVFNYTLTGLDSTDPQMVAVSAHGLKGIYTVGVLIGFVSDLRTLMEMAQRAFLSRRPTSLVWCWLVGASLVLVDASRELVGAGLECGRVLVCWRYAQGGDTLRTEIRSGWRYAHFTSLH